MLFYGIVSVIFLIGMVLVIRAVRCKKNERKLTDKKEDYTEKQKQYYAERLAKMIRCKTISEADCFQTEEFEKLRIVIRELFPVFCSKAEFISFGEDAYLYCLKGKDNTRNVMLMSHHDVVKADGIWKYPPFEGCIRENRVWGRGTVDTKTPLFAEFSALEELLEEGFCPPCNIYVFSSHNEEIAGDGAPLAKKYFEEHQIRFAWILDEGGAVIDPPMSGIHCKCAMLAVHEKGRYTLKLTAKVEKGHKGLAGDRNSPIVRMAKLISEIEKKPPFLRKMHPQVLAMFENLAPYMNFGMRLIFANMWIFKGILLKVIPRLNASAGEMLGTSCTFKNLSSDKDGNCFAEIFLRCVDETDQGQEIESLKEIAKKYDIFVESAEKGNEYYRPANIESEGYCLIRQTVEETFPYAACAPFILPAGTDARTFSEFSEAVIRFAPIDIDRQQYASVHNIDENINREAIVRAVEFYRNLLKKLS